MGCLWGANVCACVCVVLPPLGCVYVCVSVSVCAKLLCACLFPSCVCSVLSVCLSVSVVQVIYAQTDSVFVHFPAASPAEAVLLGQQAAQLVTAQLPSPIELKYERVMSPFLLLHVNRSVAG